MTAKNLSFDYLEGLYWELEHRLEKMCFQLECIGVTQPGQRLFRAESIAMIDRACPGFAEYAAQEAAKLVGNA